jgi:hypothetical protein
MNFCSVQIKITEFDYFHNRKRDISISQYRRVNFANIF